VGPGERVLIATNPYPDGASISMALYNAVQEAEALPVLLFQPPKTQLDFADEAVIAALSTRPQVFISVSELKLGKDRQAILQPYAWEGKRYDSLFHYLLYGEKLLRGFWSPSVSREIFVEMVPVDYGRLKEDCALLGDKLSRAAQARITAPGGTDILIGLKDRKASCDDGDFSLPGRGGNLPAGEVFISPQLGSSQGRIAFDGSLDTDRKVLVLASPILAQVRDGLVSGITGGPQAEILSASLERAAHKAALFEREGKLPAGQGAVYARNARNLGELGIGLNRRARIVGNMLADEKVYGTCHIAIGSNYDEDAPSLIHLDGLVRKPTITAVFADGREEIIMSEGELALPQA